MPFSIHQVLRIYINDNIHLILQRANYTSKNEITNQTTANLVTNRDLNNTFGGEDGGPGRESDCGESALAKRAFGLNLGPLNDADEAEVMGAAINASSADTGIAITTRFR